MDGAHNIPKLTSRNVKPPIPDFASVAEVPPCVHGSDSSTQNSPSYASIASRAISSQPTAPPPAGLKKPPPSITSVSSARSKKLPTSSHRAAVEAACDADMSQMSQADTDMSKFRQEAQERRLHAHKRKSRRLSKEKAVDIESESSEATISTVSSATTGKLAGTKPTKSSSGSSDTSSSYVQVKIKMENIRAATAKRKLGHKAPKKHFDFPSARKGHNFKVDKIASHQPVLAPRQSKCCY